MVLTVEQATEPSADMLKEEFEQEYAKLFGRRVAGLDIEVTSWSVNAATPAAKPGPRAGLSAREYAV